MNKNAPTKQSRYNKKRGQRFDLQKDEEKADSFPVRGLCCPLYFLAGLPHLATQDDKESIFPPSLSLFSPSSHYLWV